MKAIVGVCCGCVLLLAAWCAFLHFNIWAMRTDLSNLTRTVKITDYSLACELERQHDTRTSAICARVPRIIRQERPQPAEEEE